MISTNDVKTLIVDFLINTACIPSIDIPNGDIKFADLDIDSLTVLEMLGEIEAEYGLQIRQDATLKNITIEGMAVYIVELLSADKPE